MSTTRKQEIAVDETLTVQARLGQRKNGDLGTVGSPAGQVPLVCDFRGIREVVMKQTWEDADRLAAKRIPLTSDLWGALVKRNWEKAKELAKQQCRPISADEINRLLGM